MGVGQMKKAILFTLLLLGACSSQQLQQANQVACTADVALQPVVVIAGEAAATATGNGPAAVAAAQIDAPVHSAVVADCANKAAAAAPAAK